MHRGISTGYNRHLILLVLSSTICRLLIAGFTELGNDEVYYYSYALHLQSNYFDHPPGVALLIRLSTFNLAFTSEILLRLGAIVCAAINTFLIYKVSAYIKDDRAGWYAALLFTASVYCSIIAGTFILPDSPQSTFWILGMWLLLLIFNDQQKLKNYYWILFGISAGISIMCKVHGALLWIAAGLGMILYERKQLLNPWMYAGAGITVLLVSPIFFWNWDNAFVGYSFHEKRVSLFSASFNIDAFGRELLGGIFYQNPFNYILYVVAAFELCKGKKFISKTNVRILLLFSLPAVGIFLIIAMFRDTLPHWAAPGYYGIILITASWLSYMYELKNGQKNWMHKTVIVGNFFLLIVCLIILFIINYSPFALSSQNKLGKGDVTLEMYGYRQLGEQFAQLFYGDTATHVMKPDAFILANKWFTAAHYDYYVAQPLHLTLAAAGPVDEIHHYHWLNQKRRQLYSGCDAYFIAAEDLNQHASEIFGKKFEKISAPDTITILRNKLAVRKFYVYRMNNYRAVK